jgi:hypothetical protein
MCRHPKRRYLLDKGEDGAVQFVCEICSNRVSLPLTINPQTWNLCDVYPCACTKYGIPTFRKTENPRDESRDKVDVKSRVQLVCLRCSQTSISIPLATVEDKHLPYRRLLTTGEWGKKFSRKEVTSLTQLFPSDQVIFHRSLYDHHAIVTLLPSDGKFTVIHYVPKPSGGETGRPTSTNSLSMSEQFEARMDEYSFDEYKGTLLKVEYLPNDMNDPIECVLRAMDARGTVHYRLLRNNCEHFVQRIKTDISLSEQVKRRVPWLR